MFYAIIFLIVFSIILLIADYQNKYSWLFVVMVGGLIISLFSIVMHISVLGNYYGFGPFFELDYRIYTLVSRNFKFPLSTTARMMNVGITIYLLSVPLFVYEFRKNILNETIFNRNNIIKFIFLLVPALFYLWFYDPSNALDFYLIYHKSSFKFEAFTTMIGVFHAFNKIWIFLYLFYPVFILYHYFKEITIQFIKRQILSLALCLCVMNALFYWVFFTGPFMMSTEKVFLSGFWIFENYQTVSYQYYMIIPLITLLVLQFTLVILLNFRMGSMIHIFTDRKIQRNIFRMNEMLSDAFHSQKNTLFSINILAKQAIHHFGSKTSEDALNKIVQITSSSLFRTSEMLDSLREINYRFKNNNIHEVINEAIKKVPIPSSIQIVREHDEKQHCAICRFDFYHMSKVFVNVLNNAVEAIHLAGREKGLIRITVFLKFQWLVIEIKDNGTGIKKGFSKKLFSPYYSSKEGLKNWGLGLSYVYKVVKAHLGHVRIESRYGDYTSIQIMLPNPK